MSVSLDATSSELEDLKEQVKYLKEQVADLPQIVNSKAARNDGSDIKRGDIWIGSGIFPMDHFAQIYTGDDSAGLLYGWKNIIDMFNPFYS